VSPPPAAVRVLTGLVLLPAVAAVVWLLPPAGTLALAAVALVAAFVELARLAAALGTPVSRGLSGTAALAALVAAAEPGATDLVLPAALVALAAAAIAAGRRQPDPLRAVAVALFPAIYLGLPLGSIVALRADAGPAPTLLLVGTIAASDTAQYFTGRAIGQRPLAPAISPAKTVEGAAGGIVAAAIVMGALGAWWLPVVPLGLRVLVGVVVAALGIAGDLFESLLKRSAGVKDTSGLIPGHGGMLDRIDSWLFAAPAYGAAVRLLT
jgi:phosphatidate cytidylyltransferase